MPDGPGLPPLVLGVDGGNTKTVAALADGHGRLLSCARRGDSDIYGPGGPEPALEVLVDVVTEVLAGRPAATLGAAVFSLAGADWPEDFQLLRTELASRLGLPMAPLVLNDAIGVIRLGAPQWEGIAVACGTFMPSAPAIATGACSTSASGPTARGATTWDGRRCTPCTARGSASVRRPR